MASVPSSDIAFTATVKALQAEHGTRAAYARMEARGGFKTALTEDVVAFVEEQTSAFFATSNAANQPYVQHRGGPPGFLRVLDEHTIAFADFHGNGQFITSGNLAENPKAHLFLIAYETRQRVKLWGEAHVVRGDAELLARLLPANYDARADQAIVFEVRAWDANCPKHIPRRFEADDVRAALAEKDARIAELERALGAGRTP